MIHPRIAARASGEAQPVRVHAQLPNASRADRVNSWVAVKVTQAVGSMWCAYLFALLALLGLPTALSRNGEGIVAWIAQTFLQLVLLSVILVGQNVQSKTSDQRALDTWQDVEAILHELASLKLAIEGDRHGNWRSRRGS